MANNPEGRQNHNIYFRMPKEPEQVQEQNWIAAALWNKEGGTEISVCQQHGNRSCQYWNGQQ